MPVIISAYIFWGVMWSAWLTQWSLAASPPPYYGSPYAFEQADAAGRAIESCQHNQNQKEKECDDVRPRTGPSPSPSFQ